GELLDLEVGDVVPHDPLRATTRHGLGLGGGPDLVRRCAPAAAEVAGDGASADMWLLASDLQHAVLDEACRQLLEPEGVPRLVVAGVRVPDRLTGDQLPQLHVGKLSHPAMVR